jgi:PPOX class probable F420-dependent enzyme
MADTDMTVEQREAFLADLHVGVLAITRADKGPLAVPIWYQYDGTHVIVFMDGNSAKAKLLRRNGRATLTVQDERPPYRYVSVEGPVTVEPRRDGDDIEAMATRYLGPEVGAQYAAANPPTATSVTARLTPERWLTVDYGRS